MTTIIIQVLSLFLIGLDTIKENLVPTWISRIIHSHNRHKDILQPLSINVHEKVFECIVLSGTL